MINIQSAIHQAIGQLKKEKSEARLEAECLLSFVLNKPRTFLYAHSEDTLTEKDYQKFQEVIQQRTTGIPIAYITGIRDFWTLRLKVTPDTLIPRHETELIIEKTLEKLPVNEPLQILDLGTGSGAIALSLALERPNWHITGCDKDKRALDIARENAHQLNASNVQWQLSHWFEQITNKRFDAIISNPPYISESDPHLAEGDLPFEPKHALISGDEGLADLHYIIKMSRNYLNSGGLLLLEHGYNQKNTVIRFLRHYGYSSINCWQDLQGHDRVTEGWFRN